VAGPLLLPEHRSAAAGRLDPVSVGLSLATMLPVVYGVKEIARGGSSLLALAAVAAGGAFGVMFVRRQRRHEDPLLDLDLFGERRFSAALIVLMFGVATQAGMMFVIGLHLQLVHGLSPLAAGLWTLPGSPAMIGGSLLAPVLARRARPHVVVTAGMALAAAGFAVLTQTARDGRLSIVVAGIMLVFFGVGVMATLTQDLVLGAVAPERAGSAAAISQTAGDLGISLGIALLGAMATAVYRDGAPVDGTIADAVNDAAGLPRERAVALLDGAFDAFTSAVHVVAASSAVIAAALAILAALLLRGAPKREG
jgi:DHA2 family multidrug resistance protein-like MFS transporter